MERLFKLFSYSNDAIKENITLKSIELNKRTGEATLHFSGLKPVSIVDFKDFIECLENNTIPNVHEQLFTFTFDDFSDDDLLPYFRFVIQRLAKSSPKIIQALNYETTVENKVINIKVPQSDSGFALNRKDILSNLKKFGLNNVEMKVEVLPSNDDIAERIKKEREEIISETKKETYSEPEFVVLYPQKELVGKPIDLKELPDNEEDYNIFRNNSNSWNYIIKGYVVFFDKETMEKRGSVKFIIYDGDSYVYCTKSRFNNKDEARFFRKIDIGMFVYVQAYPDLNKFTKDVSMHIVNIKYSPNKRPITTRVDDEPIKRVELHLHTKMSALDGVPEMNEYIEAASLFGHKAMAITDHASVQSYHDFHDYSGSHPELKPLYGVELCFVDEADACIAHNPTNIPLDDATYVVFDLETTGFSVNYERIIEVSATKIRNGMFVGEFSELVNPEKKVHPKIVKLTGITNSDVENARSTKDVLTAFRDFIEGSVLVAHNAKFDMGHLYFNMDKYGIEHPTYPVIDTLYLAKALDPGRRSYGLDALTKKYGVKLENHHRASEDARATAEVFLHMLELAKKDEFVDGVQTRVGVSNHNELDSLIKKEDRHKFIIPDHINLIAKTQKGLTNLYHLISIAGTDYCTNEPILTKEVLEKYREGILVGSGCRNSYFYQIAQNKSTEDMEKIIDMFDFIEVQPQNTFEYYKQDMTDYVFCYQDTVKRIISVAKKHSIPVCATGDCHQINKEDTLYRKILVKTKPVGGERKHYLYGYDEVPAEYFMTTREMLDEFSFLGDKLAYEVVVENTNLIADACENVKSFSKTPYPPKDDFMKRRGIPSAEEYVNESVYKKAKSIYGDLLPGMVLDRIEGELEAINKNKFSTIYLISQQLVYKSRDDGYVVGSRGSVGSSFVAYLMEITEVNSLPPHYRCTKCHYSSFKMNPEEKKKYGIRKDEEDFVSLLDSVTSGYDLPYRKCPVCGENLERDGHDIPFETFLGVPQDPKTPDIDLNFSGENQKQIHNYIRELFGQTKAFRAGTILTCKDKTSYAVVRDYFDLVNEEREKEGLPAEYHKKAEIEALSNQVTGVKKTSSQHPGGIVVVPEDHEIYEVTPVQYPGDSKDRSWMTTHFDYHTFEKNLFKLDVLGHDDPTVIRYLMKFVKEKPDHFPFSNALDIPVNDSKVYQMMNDTKVLGVDPQDIGSTVATYGISEFGTGFVRGLLEEARPKTFAELVKVSGLSHGTDVWNDNAQALLNGTAKGMPKLPFSDVIGCRDDIMLDLISYGVPADLAFQTMEFVRKGKPSKDEEKWNGYVEKLRNYNVPEWYIWSCTRIKYMFPKAHATAYVIMALRIAWFKVYRPVYFYSAILSKKMVQFDIETMVNGVSAIRSELDRLKGLADKKAKEEDLITTLELALEMTVRGMKFYNVDLYKSEAADFAVAEDESGLYLPFSAIDSMGSTVAESIVNARNDRPFSTKVDFMNRTQTTKTLLKRMEDLGVLDDLPNDNQMTLDLGI